MLINVPVTDRIPIHPNNLLVALICYYWDILL